MKRSELVAFQNRMIDSLEGAARRESTPRPAVTKAASATGFDARVQRLVDAMIEKHYRAIEPQRTAEIAELKRRIEQLENESTDQVPSREVSVASATPDADRSDALKAAHERDERDADERRGNQ